MKHPLFAMQKAIVTSVALSSIFFSSVSYANGGLMITPNRVEFEDGVKSQEVKLVNRGNDITTYRVSFQNLRMNENGIYEEINEGNKGEEKPADKLIKFSPKMVTLNPGEVQTIRLMVGKASEKGEYRSHLLVKEESPAEFGNSVEEKKSNSKNVSVVLKPVFAVSIPVIVRKGELKSSVSIKDLAFKEDAKSKKSNISMKLERMGDASAYGTVVVFLTPKGSDKPKEIASVGNISIFYPYKSRNLSINFESPEGLKVKEGVLEAKFYAYKPESSEDKRGKVLAQNSIVLE